MDRLRRTAVLLTCFLMSGGVLGAEEPPAGKPAVTGGESAPVEAVYKLHQVGFHYRSDVAVYACDALKGRVAGILRAMGARDDVEVRVDNCFASMMSAEPVANPFPPDPTDPWRNRRSSTLTGQTENRGQMVGVRVNVMWPTEVTPQILAEMKKDASRRDLISRVTGNPAARLNDPVVFPAARQQFTLSRKTIGIEAIECELLEQMSTGLFRKLGVRVISRSVMCDRDGRSHLPPQMTVETLVPLAIGATQLPSMEDAGDADPAAAETPSSP
ncbi:MAG TPA: hypothetical protein PKE27_06080 [Povalibacter sp.]|nr:hypothetical protein [Povalibacter sp.]